MRDDLAREGRRVVLAAALLTRLPLPAVAIEPDWLPRAAKYLPAVGALVGTVCGALLLAAGLVWPRPIPDLLALLTGWLLTGALHEDGLADSFDALGGTTREGRLAILKDSRLGTFGSLALFGTLALQLASLVAMPLVTAAAALVAAHAGGRLAAIFVLSSQPYAADERAAKLAATSDRPRPYEIAAGALFALLATLPLLLVAPGRAVFGLALGAGVAALLAWRLCRTFGGQTGDVLGATATGYMAGFLLGAAGA